MGHNKSKNRLDSSQLQDSHTAMINDLRPGDKLVTFFVLRKKEIKSKHGSEEVYLSLEFGDASGRITGSLWEDAQKYFEMLQNGEVVKVQGKVINFKQRLHLNVEKIRPAVQSDSFNLDRLVPAVDKDLKLLFSHLDKLVASVDDAYLKELLVAVFKNDEIRRHFGQAPGGKLWHHNYRGGLLEHTLSVTEISQNVGKMYPGVNHDLLVAAGLLHDIGKIETYTYKTLIDFTDKGRLLGHIVIGAQLVADQIKTIPNFPKELENQLLHLILSHQGKLEQASPVVPMTLEGLILYYADELDSNANAFQRISRKDKKEGVKWSSYVKILDRYLYFGPAEKTK